MKVNVPGSFESGGFGFVCDTRHLATRLPSAVDAQFENFGESLAASNRLPPLQGAPVSAWILARLALLCEGRFPFRYGEEYGSDGDAIWLTFIVFSTGKDGEGSARVKPVGMLSVRGSRTEAGLYVQAAPPSTAEHLRDAFTAALLDAPTELRASCLVVIYTSLEDENHWRHVPYTIGWDGAKFLFHDSPEHAISVEDYE